MKWIKTIPNLLTLSNLFLGCLAILFSIESNHRVILHDHIQEKYQATSFYMDIDLLILAGQLIVIAAIIDFFDGFVARLLKAQSELGGQLDSLADMVTFGIAPSMIMYKLMQQSISADRMSLEMNSMALWPAFLIALGACYRLAKFNIDKEQSYYFKGLPTPSSAIIIVSIPYIIMSNTSEISQYFMNYYVLVGLSVVLCWIMVSNLPLMSLKFKGFGFKENWPKFILAGLAVILFSIFSYLAIPIIFTAYIILSIIIRKQIIQS